jgi:hypothetical protein
MTRYAANNHSGRVCNKQFELLVSNVLLTYHNYNTLLHITTLTIYGSINNQNYKIAILRISRFYEQSTWSDAYS